MAAVPVSVRVTQKAVRICEKTLTHQVTILRNLMGVQDYAVVRTFPRGLLRRAQHQHESHACASV
jgi:hypothetical protein